MLHKKHFNVNFKVKSFRFAMTTVEIITDNHQVYFVANDVAQAVTHSYIRVHPYIDEFNAIKLEYHDYAHTQLGILWRGKDYAPKFLLNITGLKELIKRLAPAQLNTFMDFIIMKVFPILNEQTNLKSNDYQSQPNNLDSYIKSRDKYTNDLLRQKIVRLSKSISKKSCQLSKLLKKYFAKTRKYLY